MFEKLADFIMKKAKVIVAVWIVLLIVSVPFIMKYNSVLQYDMSKMENSVELESVKGSEILKSGEFNSGSSLDAGTIILIETNDTLAKDVASQLKENLTNGFFFWDLNKDLRAKGGLSCEITVKQMGRFDDKYFANKDTQMLVFTVTYPTLPEGMTMKNSDNIPAIRSIVSEACDGVDGIVKTYVTGTDAISYDTRTGSMHDIKHIDPISILLVLILIGLFFRSLVTAGTPPVVIGMAYGILLAFVYGIGTFMGIYYITTILVLVSMLGAGCDYCIFIISRYREERKEGHSKDESLRESIIWAGESIMTSGISVIIGFGSLALCSFGLVRGMGIILAIGIVLALLAALTFVPALLKLVGDRIFWPTKVSAYGEGGKATKGWYGKVGAFGHRYFTHSAKHAIKYAKIFVVVTILLTVPLAYVAFSHSASYDMISAMPPGEAKDGVDVISHNIGGGVLMPTTITMKVDAFVDVNVNSDLKSGDVIPKDGLVSLTATPEPGYRIIGWIKDGNFESSTETTVTNEVSPSVYATDVRVVFEKTIYVVEFSSNDTSRGTVSATVRGAPIVSGQNAHFGNELVFTATPAEGYRVDHWDISRDGTVTTEFTHDTELTIGQASYDYDVTAYFEPIPVATHKVTFTSGGNGSVIIRADGEQVTSGSDVLDRSHIVLTALPNDGYRVSKWTINGTDYPASPSLAYDFLDTDLEISAEFEQRVADTHKLYFSSSDDALGTVTATVDGKEVETGADVTDGSKVIITAHPKDGNIVHSWQYTVKDIPAIHIPILDIDIPVGDQTYTSYTNKTEHIITGYALTEDIVITFGAPISDTLTVTTAMPNPGSAPIAIMQDGKEIGSGSTVTRGSNVYFLANVPDGYRVDHWTITTSGGTEDVNVADESLSLYNLAEDTEVTCETVENDYVVFSYGVNDPGMGTVKATCNSIAQQYVERPNAPAVYQKLNGFAQQLMDLTTQGKKNVAIAIGPLNGDMLFDGKHEWVLDTIAGILPQEFQPYVGNGMAYDALTAVWEKYVTYELKETANFYLAYRLGFISKPFTEVEGGQEYQYVKFLVVTKEEPMSALSVETVKQLYGLKDSFIDENRAEPGTAGFAYSGYLSGAAVSNYEMSELVNKDFKGIIIVVIVLLILLLFIVMRSYLTPIRAVATIIMSVVWTLGLTYLIFDVVLNTPVVWVVPIVLFVVCLGLGMDYDILLTTRIKEFVHKGMSNDDAIVAAVQKSGAIITLCGLIMAGAFGTMMVSTSPMLKEFGFALGFAIAVDALVIRTYVVPAIMHLMGDWNWKGPDYGAIKAKLFKKRAEEE